MLDYQKAPYLELNEYKAPKGIQCIFFPMPDKKKDQVSILEKCIKNQSF